jgi:pimeloyl-ACP methyl ester carboxylesterase
VSTAEQRRRQFFIRAARPARIRAAREADAEYGQPGEPSWRSIDWAAQSRRLQVKGRAVNVIEYGAGEGPPVVFIHGLAGCWQNWLENLPAAGEHRRVVALDLPGFGNSEMPAGDISITNYAETVDAVCEQLELGPVAAVGNSMGGFTAAELAIRHPERVERLVLVDAAGISIADLRRQPILTLARLLTVNASSPARERATLLRRRARHLAFRAVMRHPTRMPLDLLAAQGTGTAKPGFILAMDALISYDFRERLGEIGCPALVVHGKEDGLVPTADAEEFVRLIPQARVLLLDDTGHVPMMERPLTFNRELLRFLTEDDA